MGRDLHQALNDAAQAFLNGQPVMSRFYVPEDPMRIDRSSVGKLLYQFEGSELGFRQVVIIGVFDRRYAVACHMWDYKKDDRDSANLFIPRNDSWFVDKASAFAAGAREELAYNEKAREWCRKILASIEAGEDLTQYEDINLEG